MSDIKNMKLKLETMKGFGSITKGDILDLITTIESQNSQIESLKAITELKNAEIERLQTVIDEMEQQMIIDIEQDEIFRG